MNILRKKNYPLGFLVPGLVVFIVFFILPFFVAIGYSFTNWNFSRADFIGLENYKNILTNPDMNIAFKNTFLFTLITSAGKIILGMILALFLNQQFRMTNSLRTIFYLPAVVNMVAIGIVFTALMHPSRGLFNTALKSLGMGGLAKNWLTDPGIAIFSICAIEIWKWSGYTMMILLAGMQNISPDYYEASEIDGAGFWQKFWKITFPLIMPSFNNALVLNIIGGLKVFDLVVATTGGGPGSTTQVFNTMIYKSYSYNMQGQASAGTVILAVIVLAITLSTYGIIVKKEVEL